MAQRAVVTGGTGFIGASLVRRLLADGWRVDLLLRPGHGTWRLPEPSPRLALHLLDLADPGAVRPLLQALRPGVVFHLAAHGAYSWQTDAAAIYRTNLLATRVLAEAAVAAGAGRFVHAGTSSEYGRKDHAPAEDEALAPDSDYAIAKAAATHCCGHLARRLGVPMPTLRLYSAYGPWEEPRRLVPTLLAHGLAGGWPPLVAPGTARDFVWVEDIVEALLLAATRDLPAPDAIYNVGSGTQTTLANIVALVREMLDIRAEPRWQGMPARQWDTDTWVADSRRITAQLGWVPRVDLRSGLARTIDWLRAEPGRLEFYRRQQAPSG